MSGNFRLLTALALGLAAMVCQAQSSVNIVVDMEGLDVGQYNSDLQACQGTGTSVQSTTADRESVVGTAARGAAVGAAAGAISGNSGSKGAKTGAGAGVVAAGVRNSRNRRDASKNTKAEQEAVVKNCMRGRGYNVLN